MLERQPKENTENAEAETVSTNPKTEFATIIDSILSSSMKFPNMLHTYLNGSNNSWLFANGFNAIHGTPLTQTSLEKQTFLKSFFTKFPISENDFPAFIHLLICKLELKWLPYEEQLKIKDVQNAALSNIVNFNLTENRLIELSYLSEEFLKVFYIFC